MARHGRVNMARRISYDRLWNPRLAQFGHKQVPKTVKPKARQFRHGFPALLFVRFGRLLAQRSRRMTPTAPAHRLASVARRPELVKGPMVMALATARSRECDLLMFSILYSRKSEDQVSAPRQGYATPPRFVRLWCQRYAHARNFDQGGRSG